ncbi:MAG: alpha-L-arabinofuranosidase C-terminal domain-containing protein [Bryobacteraceae bacterium]
MFRINLATSLSALAWMALAWTPASLPAQPAGPTVLRIQADQVAAHVSPKLYGLMTEEINFSYDGGLYGELVRNRTLMEDPKEPVHWTLLQEHGGAGTMALDPSEKFNDALPTSLKLTIAEAAGNQRVGIANEGFWGIPVRPNTRYRASFYAKAAPGFKGPLTIAIMSEDGATTYASAEVRGLTETWRKYSAVFTTRNAPVSAANHLAITGASPGAVWFNMVSLFPPTFHDRPNGDRPDITQLLADMKPAFLRFPGGNYLEGNTIATRFDWKKTLGDVSQRPGHMDDAWRYWSTDGMGLAEFLEWCEDLHMEPLLAVYAGYSLRGQRVAPGPDLQPYVQDALDEIEYLTGSASTTWGARRAKDGHPAAFPLTYVEIGNEDNFDRAGGGTYDGRFTQFYDAIKAKYPKLQLIATARVSTRVPDVIDEHYYRNSEDLMASTAHMYDSRPRSGPKVFVGEWATRVGAPTPNMSAALGDAAWMTGMERNSDLVIMSSYAPLFVNVNPGGMQWRTDLIGYDTVSSYGSPAYYAQKMFSVYHGDVVLPIAAQDVPTRLWQPPTPAGRRGPNGEPPATPPQAPPPEQVPTLFFNATLASGAHTIFLKIVNRAATPQAVRIELSGLHSLDPKGQSIAMSASSPDDTNSIAEPNKIVPVASPIDGLGTTFTRTFPAYSITVLEMKGR